MLVQKIAALAAFVASVLATPADVEKRDSPCQWSGTAPFCRGACSPGWVECGRSMTGQGTWPDTGAFGLPCDTGQKARCCPGTYDCFGTKPFNCYWAGSAPFCQGECAHGYTKCNEGNEGDGAKCRTGTKAQCCLGNTCRANVVSGTCRWFGTSPFCWAECPSGYKDCGMRSNAGWGAPCLTGEKAYCCEKAC